MSRIKCSYIRIKCRKKNGRHTHTSKQFSDLLEKIRNEKKIRILSSYRVFLLFKVFLKNLLFIEEKQIYV